MSDQVEIQGNQYGWGSIIVKLDSQRFTGFSALNFSEKRVRTKSYGMAKAQAPRGRSRGRYEIENVKLTGPVGTVQELREALAAKSENGRSYGDVEFEVVAQYVERGSEKPITIEIQRCVWASSSASHSEGSEILTEDIELDVMRLLRNGLTLWDSAA